MGNQDERKLSAEERETLLKTIKERFEKNMSRHKGLDWAKIQARLESKPDKLWSLSEMERTGGEPDVVGLDEKSGEFLFYDCSAESPKGRRSYCYDRAALDARKEAKPENSVMDIAADMGIDILSEAEYQSLQKLGEFDLKSQSWLKTPADVRKLGGAIFVERRFGRVFVAANTAPCYYGNRGFRGVLRV